MSNSNSLAFREAGSLISFAVTGSKNCPDPLTSHTSQHRIAGHERTRVDHSAFL